LGHPGRMDDVRPQRGAARPDPHAHRRYRLRAAAASPPPHMNTRDPPVEKAAAGRFVASVLAGHSALGLVFAAFVYVLCLSGTVLVFSQELGRWERPDGPVLTSVSPETIVHALESAAARAREHKAVGEIFLQAPTADRPRLSVQ